MTNIDFETEKTIQAIVIRELFRAAFEYVDKNLVDVNNHPIDIALDASSMIDNYIDAKL